MKTFVDKMINLERRMADEKGPFILFALFLPEDSPHYWDLVVSAPWASRHEMDSFEYIADKIKESLSTEEILKLSRIVIVENDKPALDPELSAINIEHGIREMFHRDFFGLEIRHAFIITSRPNGSPVPERLEATPSHFPQIPGEAL